MKFLGSLDSPQNNPARLVHSWMDKRVWDHFTTSHNKIKKKQKKHTTHRCKRQISFVILFSVDNNAEDKTF